MIKEKACFIKVLLRRFIRRLAQAVYKGVYAE